MFTGHTNPTSKTSGFLLSEYISTDTRSVKITLRWSSKLTFVNLTSPSGDGLISSPTGQTLAVHVCRKGLVRPPHGGPVPVIPACRVCLRGFARRVSRFKWETQEWWIRQSHDEPRPGHRHRKGLAAKFGAQSAPKNAGPQGSGRQRRPKSYAVRGKIYVVNYRYPPYGVAF